MTVRRFLFSIILLSAPLMATTRNATAQPYQPTWESLDQRPIPAWYDEAKFGIFIHWGLYAVPAWGPKGKYAEWYWFYMQNKDGATWKKHLELYGENFRYQDFAPQFKAELFNPAQWADLFARSGAKYVVLTSKHHEGFCLWPAPDSWNWNSVDIGPHRDLAGDLAQAVKAKGLKMGFYYSLYEWFNPLYKENLAQYVDQHMLPQLKDLVTRYQPSLIFTDGEWDHPSELWRSTEFLAWLFNEAPGKDEVVVNDRWGKETRSRHGGYYTTEYGDVGSSKTLAAGRIWEECRGIGKSFGYNRNEDLEDYQSSRELIHLLIDLVSKGGNLLLNIGPTADGRIPVIMQQRLLDMGQWLAVNGEAIYGTHAWIKNSQGDKVRFTAKGNDVYAICLEWPGKEWVLEGISTTAESQVTLLGYPEKITFNQQGDALRIQTPQLAINEYPCEHAWVFKMTNIRR